MSSYLSREPVLSAEGFIGHEMVLQWIADMLERPSPQNCNVVGEPRIGKTSLLYRVYQQRIGAAGVDSLMVWVRLAELTDYQPMTFWQAMLSRLQQSSGQEIDDEFEDVQDVFDTLDVLIEELLEDGDYGRILFLIDDFDLLLTGISVRDLDWLRSLATRYADNFAFVISSGESLVDLEEKMRINENQQSVSPFANMFHNRSLSLLSIEDAKKLCQEAAVSERQPAISDEELNFLLAEVGRHPALLKISCSYLFEAKQYDQDPEMLEDVQGDVRLDRQVSWLFRQLWQRRSADEQAILSGLANGETAVSDRILRKRLDKLLGLIETRGDSDALFADAFAYWIERHQHDEPNGEETAAETAESPSDELTYIPEKRLVQVEDRQVRLTPLEGRLLVYFIENENEVCTIQDLLENVWGPGKTRSVVEKAVNRLRIKIEHDPKRPRFILSARGEGYIFRRG